MHALVKRFVSMLRTAIIIFAVAAGLLPACFAEKVPMDDESAVKAPGGGVLTSTRAPDEIAEFLRIHNQARKAVGVARLKWSKYLCNLALIRARAIAKSRTIEHDHDRHFGENLFRGTGHQYTGAAAARHWLGERAHYVYGRVTARNFQGTAHYTQMVWARTTDVGFWVARDSNGATIIVAKYGPAGNMVGEAPYPR